MTCGLISDPVLEIMVPYITLWKSSMRYFPDGLEKIGKDY